MVLERRKGILARFPGLALGFALLVASGLATAQPADSGKPKVYVFPFIKGEEVSDVVFNKAEQYFLTLFKMSTKLQIVGDDDLKAAEVKKVTEKKRESARTMAPWLEKADNLLWKGKDLLVKKSYRDAIQALNEAKELYESNYLELRDYDKLVDANLQLAIAFFRAGYKDNGEELLKDVLVWRPTLVVDKKRYPKDFVQSLDQLRELMDKRKGGVLRVEATPAAGAKVFVDGMLKGTLSGSKSGLDIRGLYRGKHYIQVVKDGYKIWAKKVGVPPAGRTAKVVADLKSAPQQSTALTGDLEGESFRVYQFALEGNYGPKFSKVATKFAEKAQVPYLLFGFVSKEPKGTKLTLFLFKSAWSATAEVEPVDFDHNLSNLQVNLLFLEANLASALQTFPKSRVVRGTPAVYTRSKKLAEKGAEPEPVAVVAPVEPPPTPVLEPVRPVEPVREQPVVVVRPEKKAEPAPVRVTPTVVEATPILPSRTEPREEEDLGELSSIFSSGGTNDPGPVVDTGIPLGPTGSTGGNRKDGDDSITGKWWFWAGVAAGVGLVGGAGYMAYDSMGPDEAGKYSATINWQTPGVR